MRRDEPAYFMENGTKRLARPANILSDVIVLREVFLAHINLRIRPRSSNGRFCPDEFVVGPGAGDLELTVSGRRWVGGFQHTRIVSQYARAASGSGLLQSISHVDIGATRYLGVVDGEAEREKASLIKSFIGSGDMSFKLSRKSRPAPILSR